MNNYKYKECTPRPKNKYTSLKIKNGLYLKTIYIQQIWQHATTIIKAQWQVCDEIPWCSGWTSINSDWYTWMIQMPEETLFTDFHHSKMRLAIYELDDWMKMLLSIHLKRRKKTKGTEPCTTVLIDGGRGDSDLILANAVLVFYYNLHGLKI